MKHTRSTRTRPAPIAALRHGIEILRVFTVEEPLLGVREIARRVGLNQSTTYRALVTLEDAGLVEFEPTSRRYRLGVGVVALAAPLLASLDVRRVALPYLEELARATDASVNLSVWDAGQVLNVEHVPGPGPITVYDPVGQRSPAHATAAGKVLLAFAPERVAAVIARGLTRLTERTIVDPALLQAELERVRTEGLAVNDQELMPDLVALAAPVFDHRNAVTAAVAVALPSHRASPERIAAIGLRVRQTASTISQRLGALPSSDARLSPAERGTYQAQRSSEP